jgi:Rod binding domain-containing protein
MSISPPTDIILDVARAADPVRYQEAAERLSRLSPSAPADGFSDALKAAGPPPGRPTVDVTEALNRLRSTPATRPLKDGVGKAAHAYEGFEAVALTSFVEAMLPKQASAVFGAGTAGDVWKSTLAEQIAAEMARSGGIGIARHLAAAHPADKSEKTKNGITQVGDAGDKALAQSAIIAANQRSFLSAIAPGRSAAEDQNRIGATDET